MDLIIYDLNLNKIHTTPQFSRDRGYISANVEYQFRDNGSFEHLYIDGELTELIRAHPEGLIIGWGDFWGFMTDCQNKTNTLKNEYRVFGTHMNGVLHKEVIPPFAEIKDTARNIAYEVISAYYPWIEWIEPEHETGTVLFGTKDYINGDEFFKKLCAKCGIGYFVNFEPRERKITFKLLTVNENGTILSVENKTASDFQEDFDLKDYATSAWYEKEPEKKEDTENNGTTSSTNEPEAEPEWIYIPGNKTGLFNQTVVLKAKNETDANKELAEKTISHILTCKVKNLKFNTDYTIGDAVRPQYKGKVFEKVITSVKIWHEGSEYNEEPKLTDREELMEDE